MRWHTRHSEWRRLRRALGSGRICLPDSNNKLTRMLEKPPQFSEVALRLAVVAVRSNSQHKRKLSSAWKSRDGGTHVHSTSLIRLSPIEPEYVYNLILSRSSWCQWWLRQLSFQVQRLIFPGYIMLWALFFLSSRLLFYAPATRASGGYLACYPMRLISNSKLYS